jgi:L-ascorbate metabolism protein UlaG (beta-lactamase superfamily)
MTRRSLPFLGTAVGLLCSGLLVACSTALNDTEQPPMQTFTNPYVLPEDTGARVSATYFLRRAWVQITRDLSRTEVPPTVPLDIEAMAQRPFAVAWLGHAAMLMRVNGLWVLLDPVLTNTAGPVAGFGPARLTSLPVALEALPHIDVVLTSHDHYDHLDLPTMRHLARQGGGPPRFFVGQGLQSWFEDQVQVQAQPFGWWQTATVGAVTFRFVPAQHSSGRGPRNRNTTLWGGWVVEHEVAGSLRRFYFPGDTAYVQAMFQDIRKRVGSIDLAALPIGAYQPRALMRFEHMDPDDAVRAHEDLGAARSFGVHWGTFQLGDEEPFAPARDLSAATKRRDGDRFGLVPIGGVLDVVPASAASAVLLEPSALVPATVSGAQRPR